VDAVGCERSLSHEPLLQVMLAFQSTPAADLALAGVRITPLPADAGVAKLDLTLFVEESSAGWSCAFEYATDLFDPASIELLQRRLETLLEAALADPGASIDHLPLMPAAERERVLFELSGRAMEE